MGGLLFGYDWVVIGGAKPFYEAYFGILPSEKITTFVHRFVLIFGEIKITEKS